MNLIDDIRNEEHYDFGKLLNTVDFDILSEYVNVHDKTNINLLLWMAENDDTDMIIKYVDKYYKLFDYDKKYGHNCSLLIEYLSIDSPNIPIYLLKKINFIKEVSKMNKHGYNLLYYIEYTISINYVLNFTGILNKPFKQCSNMTLLSIYILEYYSNIKFKNNILIMVNYFGILNKPSLIIKYNKITDTDILNKIILIYGKY
jgi:hypothetical protein